MTQEEERLRALDSAWLRYMQKMERLKREFDSEIRDVLDGIRQRKLSEIKKDIYT
jgi:hypothetical protein